MVLVNERNPPLSIFETTRIKEDQQSMKRMHHKSEEEGYDAISLRRSN